MKFRLKATCCMIILMALFFGAGGSALISTTFYTSLQQEKKTAHESYRMILNTLQIVNNMDEWTDKNLIVFCVGAGPIDNPETIQALKQHFNEPKLEKASVFYCPGGFNYEKMSAPSRLMMKMFRKSLDAKKEKTEAESVMIQMISSSYDISDEKYIEPILQYLLE